MSKILSRYLDASQDIINKREIFLDAHIYPTRSRILLSGSCSPRGRKRHSKERRCKCVRKKRRRRRDRGMKARMKYGRVGFAFAFKLLYNCILRGTQSRMEISARARAEVITDERLYKKLPIPWISLRFPLSVPASLRDFSSSPLRSSARPSFVSRCSLASAKKLVFAANRSGG